MPYIKEEARRKINKGRGGTLPNSIKLLNDLIETEGELNYVITRLCHEFLDKRATSYSTYNTIIGVLECAKQEFYRRKVSLYEDEKILENSDVE